MDRVSPKQRSQIMSRIKSVSSIERLPNSLVGLYLRPHPKGVPGSPDFGNKSRRVAVFMDGCFWHGCPIHYRRPKSNAAFWARKLSRNRTRDRRVNGTLGRMGWTVIRIWEHELERPSPGCIRPYRPKISPTAQ